jgi:hypothetical protein
MSRRLTSSTRLTRKKTPILKDGDGFKVGNDDLKIVVKYTKNGLPLNKEEQSKLIRQIKKEKYYYDYLSRKFSYNFTEFDRFTRCAFLWKGGNNNPSEASNRVLELLASGTRNKPFAMTTLPDDVEGLIDLGESSPYVAEII